jgi:formamidopyrimidine-DNA glycosylase
MPELPEVETVRRGLQPVMEGAVIIGVEARRPDLRFPLPERFNERLTGKTIVALARRAKYLILHLEGGPALICHLGMSGSFRIEAADGGQRPGHFYHERSKNLAHDHVVFDLRAPDGAPVRVVFNDPRRFGFMLFCETAPDEHPMLADLGVEPTGNILDGPLLASLLDGRKSPLKAALLDQRLIAGLGNIYVSEALWRAHLSPLREAGTISGRSAKARERASHLASAVRSVIADAIAAGGSSLRDYMQTDGSLGYFQHAFAVYDREGQACQTPGCTGHIERIVQSGRSTFYCRVCQK